LAEQVRGDVITTSSDIYVLGVLLYELLCGRRPFQLLGSSLLEMEKIICDQEAPTPSEMVSRTARESPELLTDIVACRSTTPARLQKFLHGEVDSIIGMAMRKDPERRYSSAEQLAADLERHLNGKPVIASKDTWFYRTRKFVGRHKLAVAASTVAIITLAAFATITFVQAQRIAYERDVSNAERTRAEQVSSFLVELFELSDPSRSRGNQVTARELLDIGARRVSLGLADQPETRATLLGTIGTVYQSLGLYSDSVALLEEGLQSRIKIHGPRHPDVAVALRELGDAYCDRGDLPQCETRLNAALDMQRELLGADALEIAPTIMAQAKLAQLRGDFDAAERLYNQSLQMYRAHGKERTTDATSVMNELAGLYSYRGWHDRAATLYRAALDIDRQTLGNDHPQVGQHVHNLAVALHEQGKLDEAAPLYEESMQTLTRVLGEKHPQTIDAAANYGRFLQRRGELERAETILSKVVELDRQARGPRHAFVAHDLVNLGMVRLDRQQQAQAEQDFRAALDIYAEALPPDHPYVASALTGLGRCMLEQNRLAEAEQTLRHAKEIAAKSFAINSPQVAAANSSLGRVLMAQRRPDEAAKLLRDSYPILVQAQGENAVITQRTREALAQLDARR